MKMIVTPQERDINKYDSFGRIDLNTQSLIKAAREITHSIKCKDEDNENSVNS